MTHFPSSDVSVDLLKNFQYPAQQRLIFEEFFLNKENSINRFLKKSSVKHFPATGEASLCGTIIECNVETGLATNINQFIFGGDLKNSH